MNMTDINKGEGKKLLSQAVDSIINDYKDEINLKKMLN